MRSSETELTSGLPKGRQLRRPYFYLLLLWLFAICSTAIFGVCRHFAAVIGAGANRTPGSVTTFLVRNLMLRDCRLSKIEYQQQRCDSHKRQDFQHLPLPLIPPRRPENRYQRQTTRAKNDRRSRGGATAKFGVPRLCTFRTSSSPQDSFPRRPAPRRCRDLKRAGLPRVVERLPD